MWKNESPDVRQVSSFQIHLFLPFLLCVEIRINFETKFSSSATGKKEHLGEIKREGGTTTQYYQNSATCWSIQRFT